MTEETEARLVHVTPDRAIPWPGLNRRRRFDPKKQAELRESVASDGVLEPLLATTPDHGHWLEDGPPDADFLIVAGERRWRAASELQEKGEPIKIPLLVRPIPYLLAVKLVAVENIQREAMTAMEEAWQLDAWGQAEPDGITQTEMAFELGRSQAWVANRLRLLRLSASMQEQLQAGHVTHSQAREYILPFTNLRDRSVELELYDQIAGRLERLRRNEDDWPMDPDELVKIVAAEARKLSHPVAAQGWGFRPRDDNEVAQTFPLALHDECGCGAPEYPYGDVWGNGERSRRCFDGEWWQAAEDAAVQAKAEAEEAAEEERDSPLAWGDPDVLHDQERVAAQMDSGATWGTNNLVLQTGRFGQARNVPLADPRELEPETLIVQEAAGGHVRILTCELEALEAAREVAEAELEARVKERRALHWRRDQSTIEQVGMDPEGVGRIIRRALPELIRGSGVSAHELGTVIQQAGLGSFEVPQVWSVGIEAWMETVQEQLEALDSDAGLREAWLVYLLRVGRGDFEQRGSDAAEVEVRAELWGEYHDALRDSFPYIVPEPPAEEDDDPEA